MFLKTELVYFLNTRYLTSCLISKCGVFVDRIDCLDFKYRVFIYKIHKHVYFINTAMSV